MLNQEVLFGVTGQTFFYDCPEARPSAPTVSVFRCTTDDNGSAELATTGAASVDAVNTTFSASQGDTSFTVTSAASIVRGRRYLVTATDLDREWVEVISILGTTIGIRQPLKNAYAAGSTFQGCRISISVDSTWIADISKITDILDMSGLAWRTDRLIDSWVPGAAGYRLRWSYTANSVTCLGISFADVVRYQAKNLVTPLDVDRRFPGWIDRLPPDYAEDQGQGLIDEAFQALKMDALGDAQLVRRIRNTEVVRELVVYRANMIAVEASAIAGASNAEQVKLAGELYEQRYLQLLREPKVPTDATGGGSSAQPQREPAWRR